MKRNRKKRDRPTVERLKEIFYYDPIVGILMWKVNIVCNIGIVKKIGDIAKAKDTAGYIQFTADGCKLNGHRAAWAIHHGEWPTVQIDHINGQKSDNRLCNLRLATMMQNHWNRPCTARNTTGRKGVHIDRRTGKFVAKITARKTVYSLGSYATADEASEAYKKAAIDLHGSFMRTEEFGHAE